MSKLEDIKARWAKATKGPWTADMDDGPCHGIFAPCADEECDHRDHRGKAHVIVETDSGCYAPRGPDAQAIAAAPSDVAWLVAEVERLRKAMAWASDQAREQGCSRLSGAILMKIDAEEARRIDDEVKKALAKAGGDRG